MRIQTVPEKEWVEDKRKPKPRYGTAFQKALAKRLSSRKKNREKKLMEIRERNKEHWREQGIYGGKRNNNRRNG